MKNTLYIVILLGIVTGFLVPAVGRFAPAIPYMIVFLLFLNFLDIDADMRRMVRRELLVTVPLSAAVTPLLVYYVLSQGLSDEYRAGLFLTAIAPSGIMMLVFSRFVPFKDFDLIIANFLATQFGTVLYMPVMTGLALGASIEIDAFGLFLQIAAMILTPFAASTLFKRFCRIVTVNAVKRAAKPVVPVLVYCIIAASIGRAAGEFVWERSLIALSLIVLSIYVLQGGLAYAAGFLFGDKSIRNTMALSASSRNIQLMLGVAIVNFPPLVLIPMILGVVFHHITNAVWLYLFRK